MKRHLAIIVGTALLGSTVTGWTAELSGKVRLKGSPPKELTIAEAEAMCGHFMKEKPLTTHHWVVGEDGGLGNVLVYIKEGAKPTPPPPNAPMPVLDQVGCEYVPYMLGVQVGQKFKIRNSDPILHNVHATPKVNREFNLAQPIKGMETIKSFDKPEIFVRMKCDVHPWMFAYIAVLEHPYFCVTDKNGNYKIPNIPPGKYTLEIIHRKAGTATKEITLGPDDKLTLDWELKAP